MALNDTQKTTREGVAYATVLDAFPKLRKQHPYEFTSDVQTLYEFMLQVPKQGPGLLQLHGNPHQELTQWDNGSDFRHAIAAALLAFVAHGINHNSGGSPV